MGLWVRPVLNFLGIKSGHRFVQFPTLDQRCSEGFCASTHTPMSKVQQLRRCFDGANGKKPAPTMVTMMARPPAMASAPHRGTRLLFFLRRRQEGSHNEMSVTGDGSELNWELEAKFPPPDLTDSVPEPRVPPSSVPASTSQRVWVAPASSSNGPLPTNALQLLSGGGASS